MEDYQMRGNHAVERSKSEFVIFVDSDDWVSERFIQNLVEGLTSSEIDMVVSPISTEQQKLRKDFLEHCDTSAKAPCAMEMEEALVELCKEKYYGNHAWSKLFRLGLLKAYPVSKGQTL